MPVGKGHRPLFDLIETPLDRRPHSPTSHPEPFHKPDLPPPRPAFEPAPDPTPAPRPRERDFRIPRIVALYALALAVGLLLLTWWGGVQFGRAETQRRLARLADQPSIAITEPTVPAPQPRTPSSNPPVQPQPTQPQPSVAKPPTQPQAPSPQPGANTSPPQPRYAGLGSQDPNATLTPEGWALPDPRTPGWNYMPLGIVFAREALEIIPFFRQQGIEVIAAPLDSARRAGDNSDPGDRRYRLWALPGLPGGEAYRQRASDKTRMIREVNDAIARLQRERRSGSMPVTGEWERFNP